MIETNLLQNYLEGKEKEWESFCIRCGGCCGAFDDPCLHLRKDGQSRYYCEIYINRFGQRQALSGEKFRCVPVKEIIHTRWRNDCLCTYKKYLRTQ